MTRYYLFLFCFSTPPPLMAELTSPFFLTPRLKSQRLGRSNVFLLGPGPRSCFNCLCRVVRRSLSVFGKYSAFLVPLEGGCIILTFSVDLCRAKTLSTKMVVRLLKVSRLMTIVEPDSPFGSFGSRVCVLVTTVGENLLICAKRNHHVLKIHICI